MKQGLRYVFFGTPRFAEIVFDGLIGADMPPIALVCNPDRPVGRKKIVTPPPTKQLVLKRSTETTILQPETFDADILEKLAAFKADCFVVAAYAKIIPRSVLTLPRLGTLGVHPSLLPKYRGASPIQSAILNGETKTGVTIYLMDEKMDHGPMLAMKEVALDSLQTQYAALEENLARAGAELLVKTLPGFVAGALKPELQDESEATYTKKFVTQDGFVDEKTETPEAIVRKVNAFTPEPGAWTIRNGRRVKLLKAEVQKGALRILVAQEEGGKPTAIGGAIT